jgi:hypothetical protein
MAKERKNTREATESVATTGNGIGEAKLRIETT